MRFNYVGITCGGFESFDDQFIVLLTVIEVNHSLETKSRFKKSLELKCL